MQDLVPFTASLAPGLQLLFGLLAVFLIGAVAGYMARAWQEQKFLLHDDDTATASPSLPDEAAPGARERTTAVDPGVATPAGPPARPAPAPRPKRPAARPSTPAPASGAGSATVLVADDRAELLALHGAYLERHGYRVLTATDGDAALSLARAEHPAVIVLDHSMPGRSGIEVTRALKSDPDTADIPVILMTAHSYGAIGASARAAGCAAFMPKPCDPTRVLREIAAFVPLAPAGQA